MTASWSLHPCVAMGSSMHPGGTPAACTEITQRWVRDRILRRARRIHPGVVRRLLRNRRDPARLIVCGECRARLVNPVDWHESGDSAWWVRLRCGACGFTRVGVISNADAQQLERDLSPGMRQIKQAVLRLDRARMLREADAFITALERDLIDPADFARH